MTIRVNCCDCGNDFDAPESVAVSCGVNDLICDECAMGLRDEAMGDDCSEFDDEDDYDYDTDREDFYLPEDEPWDGFRDDVEADADVLRMAGMGTDEDYGYYGDCADEYYDDGHWDE